MSEPTSGETKRPLPPPLEFPTPPCSVCGADTEYNDGFDCTDCGASWPKDVAHLYDGTWRRPDAEQCASEITPHLNAPYNMPETSRHVSYRCFRTKGHVGAHTHPDWQHGWNKGWGAS